MRVLVISLLALSGVLLSGCQAGCGEYTHQTGLSWDLTGDDQPPESLDDYTLHEICGDAAGSFGDEDFSGEGIGWLQFDGSHRNAHVSQITSGIFQDVYFHTASLVVGGTLDIRGEEFQDTYESSKAYVLDSSGVGQSGAGLTRGEIEVLDRDEDIDAIYGSRRWRLRWDLTFGEPGETEFWYTASGEDWLHLTVAGPG